MKKLATKLTPAIKAWIKEEFGSDFYSGMEEDTIFCFPTPYSESGFKEGYHISRKGYTEVSEAEFLAEFGNTKVEYQMFMNGIWYDLYYPVRIKPTPDYSKEIEALQEKAKENGMTVTINFEKL